MSFVKNGDSQPIQSVIDSDGNVIVCSKCGLNKTLINLEDDTALCICEELQDE